MVNHILATTLEEVLNALQQGDTEIIAGGTDLMVQRRNWANTSPRFSKTVNIFNVQELHYIKVTDNHIHIGSTTPLSEVLQHPDTPSILKKAIYDIASPALRNVATIAGNIGNASPAGDTLPILYLLDAVIVLKSKQQTRLVPIHEVITGVRQTTIKNTEVIIEIILPKPSFTTETFVKVGGRKADAISKVSFSGAAVIKDNVITDIRIVFGAVAPTMVRSKQIEQKLIGTSLPIQNIAQIMNLYEPLIVPIDDQRSSKLYRKKVAKNLLTDFLTKL